MKPEPSAKAPAPLRPADLADIDTFCDALWLEDGLAKTTLDSYRADLTALGRWLAETNRPALLQAGEADLLAFVARLAQEKKATSQARYLSSLRRFYRWQVSRGRIATDPTGRLSRPITPGRLPKTLSEAQVEALLKAPDIDTPLGQRDRAMLETLYATGLRASELVGLKLHEIGFNEGVLRVMGKGSKERLVPLGEEALDWLQRFIREGRRALLGERPCNAVFVTARAAPMTRQMFWTLIKGYALRAGIPGNGSPRMCCGTPSPPTCSTTAPTCGWCNYSWAIPTSPPPRFIPTWRGNG